MELRLVRTMAVLRREDWIEYVDRIEYARDGFMFEKERLALGKVMLQVLGIPRLRNAAGLDDW